MAININVCGKDHYGFLGVKYALESVVKDCVKAIPINIELLYISDISIAEFFLYMNALDKEKGYIVIAPSHLKCVIFRHDSLDIRCFIDSRSSMETVFTCLASVLNGFIQDKKSFIHHGLTSGERKILHYIIRGVDVNDISMILSRSIKTVSTMKRNAMRKMNIHCNQELFFTTSFRSKPENNKMS